MHALSSVAAVHLRKGATIKINRALNMASSITVKYLPSVECIELEVDSVMNAAGLYKKNVPVSCHKFQSQQYVIKFIPSFH